MCAANDWVEVRARGSWIRVPALEVGCEKVIAKGKWLRIAAVRSEEFRENELEDPELYIRTLKDGGNRGLNAHVFSFTQKLPSTHPRYPYPMEWDSVAAIKFMSFTEWWEALPSRTRQNVRRAKRRGVVVKIREFDDELIEGIRDVNDDSRLRQRMPNAYYGKSFNETKKLYGEFVGRCDFICSYFGNELIGFLHLIYRGNVASVLNLTTKPRHFDKRPANALLAKAVEICSTRRINYLTYGNFNYGNKRDDPLREFKIRNGFEEMLVPRFYVPLTPWGAICVELKLYRGLLGILPPSVISLGIGLRSWWYNLRFSQGRCSSMAEQPNGIRQKDGSNPPAGSNVFSQ